MRATYKQDYPKVIEDLRQTFKYSNTEAAEQTFVWLGKFKKILNGMDKRRHHFFLHCLVKERNRYTEWCFNNNMKPKLPQAKSDGIMIAPTD